MCLLIETIRSEDGKLINLSFHNQRFNRSVLELFGLEKSIDLEEKIVIPAYARSGLFKCRIEYDSIIKKVEFISYKLKEVRSLKIIRDNTIDYSYKYQNRTRLDELFSLKGKCDDILIVKNGYVTDTSYSNVVFKDVDSRWVTPSTYLLNGTRRTGLLKKGVISESEITLDDIKNYSEIKLINAMIDLEESPSISINNVSC